MKNRLPSFVAGLALVALAVAPAAAQRSGRFEIVPQVGYTFGGGFDVDPQVFDGQPVPGGKLKLDESMSYGVTLGFEGARGTFFTVTYNYQPTQLSLDLNGTPPNIPGVDFNKKGDISLHQVIFGGRWEYMKSSEQKARPYLGVGMGFVIVDPNFEIAGRTPGSETRFLLSANGGVRYMMGEEKRFGLQADIRGTWFWVPSGDYYTWCDYWYGCSVYEGSATIAQGTVSGGVVIKF